MPENFSNRWFVFSTHNIRTCSTKNKGTLAFLRELGVSLQGELQQISRAEIGHIIVSMPDSCRVWVSAGGGHTRYRLKLNIFYAFKAK